MTYQKRADKIMIAPQNMEGENLIDLVNLCGEADREIADLQTEKSSLEDDIIRFNDICVKKTRGLAKQLKAAVDALENIQDGTTDIAPPYRAMGATQMRDVAIKALTAIRKE